MERVSSKMFGGADSKEPGPRPMRLTNTSNDSMSASRPSVTTLKHKSDKHASYLLNHMYELYKNNCLCDVTIHVSSTKIFAHKVVLTACSPYFRAMFTGELAESKMTEITIRELDDTALQTLIDFCYTAQVVVEESNVQTLLPAACLLQLTEIKDVCCDFLRMQLDPTNVLGIRAFADTHSCRELLQLADKFTQISVMEIHGALRHYEGNKADGSIPHFNPFNHNKVH